MLTRTAAPPVLQRRRGAALVLAALFLVTSTVAGCSPSTEEAASADVSDSVADDLPEAASSDERIAAALEAGEIDEPTSLLYRLWAQFGDRSLPEQYRGAPAPHDLSILSEVHDALESMPVEIRTQIEPFLQRPSDPGSAFSGGAEPSDSAASENTQALAIRNVAQTDDSDDAQRCSQDWVSEAVPDQPFRVWACPDEGNDAAERTIAAVADVLSERAGEMIADAPDGMGAPIPDEPDADANQPSDDKIDIYVLPHGWLAPYRDLNERRMDDMAAAITMSAAPRTGNSSSAYMLLGSYLLDHPEALERVLVHEVFHVLQNAHFSGVDLSTAWVFEASAKWAETHFASDFAEHAYRHHMSVMQDSQLSLVDADFEHRYSAFLWFLFMHQEAGPEAVFGVWHALDSAPGGAGSDSVVAAIDSQINLESAFPEFAMRLLNADLPGDPITPRFQEIAPNLPDGEQPELQAQPLTDDSLSLDHDGIPGLGYRYTRVTLPNPEEMGTSVQVSSDLGTPSGTSPSIEALVEDPDGDYARVPIDPTGTDLCVASDLLLVVANPSGAIDDEITGAIDLIRDEGAGCDTDAPAPSESSAPSESPAPSEAPAPSEPPAPSESPTPSEPPASAMPPASPDSRDGSTDSITGDYCTDMLQFQRDVQGLADASALPVTAQRVAEIFGLAEPHLPNVADGGIELVEILRSYAEQAADQPASSAAAILDNEEFQRLTGGISFHVQYCDDAP